MGKSILLTTLAFMSIPLFSASAQNYDRREDYRDRDQSRDRGNYRRSSDYRQLRAEIDQLNIMFSRVNAQLRTYGAGRYVHRDYSRLLRDRDRLNYELQRGSYDRLRIHAQIDRLRDKLREIEARLRFRSHRYYRAR